MSACDRIPAEPVVHVSANACQSDQRWAFMSKAAMSADYPTVVANCVTGKQLASIGFRTIDLRRPLTETL